MEATDDHDGRPDLPVHDPTGHDRTGDELVEPAIELARGWIAAARHDRTPEERRVADRLAGVIADPIGVRFTMRFVDRVARHRAQRLAADQLRALVADGELPDFLGRVDRTLLTVGGRLAPLLPGVVMPLARRRLRTLVGHLVVDAAPRPLHRHLDARHAEGVDLNVNLLGEMVLGDDEAQRRVAATLALIDDPAVDHVSVKVSGIASQLDLWSERHSLARVADRLRLVLRRARASDPPTFVNLDMEEYRDLHLTIEAFTRVLDEPELEDLEAGIVLQAYLPDTVTALDRLTAWAAARHARTGAGIRIRLVKGANLAMERVEAELHGWPQAPYPSKHEVDANYERCLDRALHPERAAAVRIGVASHNLFDVAWAHLLAEARGVADRVEFEMLQGIAPGASRAVRDRTGSMLLYTPIVGRADFDVAIAYLFRRLEETAAPQNFLRHLLDPATGDAVVDRFAAAFRASVADRHRVASAPRRATPLPRPDHGFANEPDSDPTQPDQRRRIQVARDRPPGPPRTPMTTTTEGVDRALTAGRHAHRAWTAAGGAHRRTVLRAVADELARRRPDLVAAMVHEGRKTLAEADPEVSEAIDFARWYAELALEPETLDHVTCRAFGVVAVVPPWNFPVAIPAGGTLAALAAGNAVVLKPAPETPRCAELVAEACWSAGVDREVLQFVRTPDDEAGTRLVTGADAVVFTGSWETAAMFRRWRPDIALFAETSGKNALVVTPQCDQDLAVADLVRSAFGHSGQKCSAASLAILVGELADDPRFTGKLVDAAASLHVGWPTDHGAVLGPLIAAPRDPLLDALTHLQPGERWLLAPRRAGGRTRTPNHDDGDGALWSPGIKTGVQPGSPFHLTECFGPVLGLMRAPDLDTAIELQNATPYGLTGGIHSLDDDEVEHWLDRVQVGNAYVNRHITGAIVRRQPFGGWKRSVLGPGAKAGGPDQVLQLLRFEPRATPGGGAGFAEAAAASDEHWLRTHYGREHDPSGLACETNVLRYLPRPDVVIRAGADADPVRVLRTADAARRAGCRATVSLHPALAERTGATLGVHRVRSEGDQALADRLGSLRWGRIRMVGAVPAGLRAAAHAAEVDVIDAPVTANGRIELRWYLREQAVSRTRHRFGTPL